MYDMQDNNQSLSCNSCRANVDGIAYRTACLHLLCPTCAKNSFIDGHTCTICSTVLSKGDVKESIVGVSAQVEISDSLFQIALARTSLSGVVENLHCMRLAFVELENFVSAQLLLETSLQQDSTSKALEDNTNLNNKLSSMNTMMRTIEETNQRYQLDAEELIKSREKEMSELKDAYKEKHRKCQAWEKAYNNIRDQVVIPTDTSKDDGEHKSQKGYVAQYQSGQNSHKLNQQYVSRDNNPLPSLHTRLLSGERFPQPLKLSPALSNVYVNPTRALRRTEVTTYSKSFAPEGQYNEHSSPHSQADLQQRADGQHHFNHSHTTVSRGPTDRQNADGFLRYYPIQAPSPLEQRNSRLGNSIGYESLEIAQRGAIPPATFQRAGYKKRTRGHIEDENSLLIRDKSSFFD